MKDSRRERFKTVPYLLIVLLSAQTAAAEDLPQYSIKARIDTQKKTVHATQTVRFTNNHQVEIDSLYFHIYPNRKFTDQEKKFILRYGAYFKVNPFPDGFQEASLTFQSVVLGNQPIPYEIQGKDHTLLRIPLPASLHPGESIEVELDYTVSLPHAYGRLGWHENILTLSRWYPILSVFNETGWKNYPFYPFHRPFFSEAANYQVELSVPQEYTVIHSGQLQSETITEQGIKIWSIDTPLPIREFSLALSPDYRVYEEDWNEVTLKAFYLPGDEQQAKQSLRFARELMEDYSKRFTPYPYHEFSIAPVYLGYGGEQMSNLVLIDTRVFQLPQFLYRYLDFLIAHETGHQWFYNLVGIDEYAQIWLEEGVHSYFILEYLEKKYGRDAAVVDFPKWLKGIEWLLPNLSFRRARTTRYQTITRIGLDHPVVDELSSFQEPSSIFSLTYGKGSSIISMLRDVIGKDVFDRVFQRIFKEYSFKNLSVEDFQRICEEESLQDLTWFFEQWLSTTKQCDYAVVQVKNNTIILENRGQIVMPVEVLVKWKNGPEKKILWEGQNPKEALTFSEKEPIEQVSLDPEEKLLDVDRTNNHWPRRLHLKLVPIYLGLYEVPVFLPEDSYNLVVGPEVANNGLGLRASWQKPYEHKLYAATSYEFGESYHHSSGGYQIQNLFNSPTTAGVEVTNRADLDDGEDDLVTEKIFVRRELWPVSYGVADINDHVTFYALRNRRLSGGLLSGGLEDVRNISYRRARESILGTAFHFGRNGPYPDPREGYRVDALFENAGHFWGAEEYFYRTAVDVSVYSPVTPRSHLAFRLKSGWGFPEDKLLFEIGGWDGLRGFDRKTIRGASALLGSVEYRFPIREDLGWSFFDHLFGLDSIRGVVFFDAGQSWFDNFDDGKIHKDAGVGLRATINVGSFLEKVVVRADLAQPIDEPREDPRFWFGINHAF